MSRNYQRKTDRLNRSFDCLKDDGSTSDPYKLLACAIIFQAAADCSQWKPETEAPCYYTGGSHGAIRYMRKAKLTEFINSDWLDMLLCWQNEIKPEAVREELTRRLMA